MASENETVDDIIAINRAIYQGCDECSLSDKDVKWFLDLLDRIESAWTREVEKLRDVGNQMLRRWCNKACTCQHCEFNAEPCSRWRKILEGENNGK